jgi:hypothetical protein
MAKVTAQLIEHPRAQKSRMPFLRQVLLESASGQMVAGNVKAIHMRLGFAFPIEGSIR